MQQVVRGVADDILERLDLLDGLREPHPVKATGGGHDIAAQAYDTSAYKMAADDLLLSAGVDIRFHSFAVGVAMNGPCIDAVLVETKSGRKAIKAEMFIDCSGTAILLIGRERNARKATPRDYGLSNDDVPRRECG